MEHAKELRPYAIQELHKKLPKGPNEVAHQAANETVN
jgi:hypothetical protein